MKDKVTEGQTFIQNDGICFDYENREGWFVDRNMNTLQKINLDTMELRFECCFNTGKGGTYRRNFLCYKKNRMVVIFPDRGEKILFYDEKEKNISEYEVKKEADVRIGMYCVGEYKDLLWTVSYGMKQIFLIDVGNQKIVKNYKLFEMDTHIEMGFESILAGESIFCVSRNSKYISETNLVKGEERIYELTVEERGFNTILYAGECFWLSSMKGNIYIWDIENNNISQIYAHDGTMYRSIKVGEFVCFLPMNLTGNLHDDLLCFNIEEKTCSSFAINGQKKEGIYVFQYIKENEIIGINHSENNFITEINIKNGKRNTIYMNITERYLKEKRLIEVKRDIQEGNMVYEREKYDLNLYLKSI